MTSFLSLDNGVLAERVELNLLLDKYIFGDSPIWFCDNIYRCVEDLGLFHINAVGMLPCHVCEEVGKYRLFPENIPCLF